MTFKDIPVIYKSIGVVVAATVFVLTYHDRFITEAEAAELQKVQQAQLILLRVDNKEAEKRTLVREKAKAVEENKLAQAEKLEQDIQTLRDQIKGLCDQIEEC